MVHSLAPPPPMEMMESCSRSPVKLRIKLTFLSVTVEKEASIPTSAPSNTQCSSTLFFSLPRMMIPCQSDLAGSEKRDVKTIGFSFVPVAADLPCISRVPLWQGDRRRGRI